MVLNWAHCVIKINFDNDSILYDDGFLAVTFLEYWKRKSASLAHHWDCMGFQEEEERPRPDFAAKAPYLEKNPVTFESKTDLVKILYNHIKFIFRLLGSKSHPFHNH